MYINWKEIGKRWFNEELKNIEDKPLSVALTQSQDQCFKIAKKKGNEALNQCIKGTKEAKIEKESQTLCKPIYFSQNPNFKDYVKISNALTQQNKKEHGFRYKIKNNIRIPTTPIVQGTCNDVSFGYGKRYEKNGMFHTHTKKHSCSFSELDKQSLEQLDEISLSCEDDTRSILIKQKGKKTQKLRL